MKDGYARLDSKISRERHPSGDCRNRIGQVLSTRIGRLKTRETVKAKAHEEWMTTQRGSGQPWSQSVANLSVSPTISSSSHYRPSRSVASVHSEAHLTSTMPDLRALYNAHAAFAQHPSYHAPSITATEYSISRASSKVTPPGQFATVMVQGSSVESMGASADCSLGTYTTDATSILPQSPKPSVGGKGKLPLDATPRAKDDYSPVQEHSGSLRSVKSITASSHRSDQLSASFYQPLSQKVVTVEAAKDVALPPGSTTHSMRTRSDLGSSYATSQLVGSVNASAQYPGHRHYPSSPSRYRGGTLRTVGVLPYQNSMNLSGSSISIPSDRRSSIATSNPRSVSPGIVNATPLGLVCGQGSTLQGPDPPRTPSRPHSRLSYAQTIRRTPTPRLPVPIVDSFTSTLRSANTASFDNWALSQGDHAIAKAKELQRLGIHTTQRQVPGYVPHVRGEEAAPIEPSTRIINSETGQPFMTLYERLEQKEKMDGKRLGMR